MLRYTAGCTAWPLFQEAGTCRLDSVIGQPRPRDNHHYEGQVVAVEAGLVAPSAQLIRIGNRRHSSCDAPPEPGRRRRVGWDSSRELRLRARLAEGERGQLNALELDLVTGVAGRASCAIDKDTSAAHFASEAVEVCDERQRSSGWPGRTLSRDRSRGTSRRPSALAPTRTTQGYGSRKRRASTISGTPSWYSKMAMKPAVTSPAAFQSIGVAEPWKSISSPLRTASRAA